MEATRQGIQWFWKWNPWEKFLFRCARYFVKKLENKPTREWVEFKKSQVRPVFKPENRPSQDMGETAIAPYNPNKNKSLKSLIWQGSSADTWSLKDKKYALPQWALEIPPFLANQLSRHTQRAYENDLKQFFSFLDGRISPHEIHHLRPDHIILYRKFLEEGRLHQKPLEKSTINRKLAVIKSFFKWLEANQVVEKNPAQLVKGFPQSQESALQGLSDAEVCKILEEPDRNKKSGALHLAILNVLFYLGLRKGELIQLKMGDIDTERGVRVLKVRGKGHRVRILPITDAVYRALENYFFVCGRNSMDKEAQLFQPTKNPRYGKIEKPLNPHAITYLVLKYAKKAGVLKNISPHSCRATCISNALDRKASHRSVQHLAGWSTPLMIQRYDKRREDLKNSAAYQINYHPPAA